MSLRTAQAYAERLGLAAIYAFRAGIDTPFFANRGIVQA